MHTEETSQSPPSQEIVQQLIVELDQAEQRKQSIQSLYHQAQERIQQLEAELHTRENALCNLKTQLARSYDVSGQHKSRYFDLSPIGMASILPDLTWLEVNSSLCEMLGYGCDKLIELSMTNIVYPDDIAQLEHVRTLLHHREQESATLDLRFVRYDHRIIYTSIILHVFEHTDTTPLSFLCLIQDITERKQAEDDLRIFETIMKDASVGIAIATLDATLIYHNLAFSLMHGYDDVVGLKNTDFVAEESIAILPEIEEALHTQGSWNGLIQSKRKNGSVFPAQLSLSVIVDKVGNPHLISVIVHDNTEIQQAEEERARLQEQVITMQETAIRELSSPLLPIAPHVVVMPLIGSIDSQRAQQIMDTLLEGVAYHQAEYALLDLTGIQVADTQVATTLVSAARAAELLGAVVVVTGIAPAMAQTLVHLGADLSTIVTRSTLQEGIQYTLKRQSTSKSPAPNKK